MSYTLSQPITVAGRALRCGKQCRITLTGRQSGGITAQFAQEILPVTIAHALEPAGQTSALYFPKNKQTIFTTEHLFAALWGMGIFHAHILFEGDGVPLLDGSAQGWCSVLAPHRVPALEPDRYTVKKIGTFCRGEGWIVALPCTTFRLTVAIDFSHPAIGKQMFTSPLCYNTFAQEIAPARTFCTEEQAHYLSKKGWVKGADASNCIVFAEHGPLNTTQRFSNEPARHKWLDLLGDLVWLGKPLSAHLIAYRPSHLLTYHFVHDFLNNAVGA